MASMCFGGDKNGDDPDAKKSKEIEKQLREDQKKMSKEVKMLLLGMALPSLTGNVSMVY
jgi:guanine nucleotide-binding protein subunit alpha